MSIDSLAFTVDVKQEILAALRALEADYQKNGQEWRCPSNPADPQIRGSGNIIGSEALLCFLLPLSNMRSRSDFQKELSEIIDLNSLRERVENHLLKHRDRADFTGHPYTLIVDSDKINHPFIDSYCFIISLLVLYNELFGAPVKKATQEHFKFLFRVSLETLKNSAVKGSSGRYTGFFVTDKYLPEFPFKYPTWMAIDTLSDLRSLHDLSTLLFSTPESRTDATTLLNNISNDIGAEYRRIYIDNDLTDKEREAIKGRNVNLTQDIIREDEDDSSPHYNLWAAIILLHLRYNDTEKLADAFKVLMPYIDDQKKFRVITGDPCKISFYSANFPAGEAIDNVITDRCFLPQYVKGLSLLLTSIPRLRDDQLFAASLDKSVVALLKNRKKDVALWDRFAERGAPYAIYQTERAIEAFCALFTLQETVSIDAKHTTPSRRQAESFDGNLMETVLRHAIVLRIGEDDARSIIAREVAQQGKKIREDLFKALQQLASTIEGHFAQDNKSATHGLTSEILGWAKEFKITND